MELTLLVIRSAVPEQLAEFYQHFGMTFEYHQHGNGPYHYSGHIGPTLLEIYPMAKGQEQPDITLRLGLAINSFDDVIDKLQVLNTIFHQPPTRTEWGVMAVIKDPEGRKIELYKK
jgi:lactoylglutathione lyase